MKFKRYAQLEHGLKQIALTPLINVLFLLLFFILLFILAEQGSIDIRLPKAVTSDVIQKQNITITISNENIIYFNSKIVTIKELESILSGSDNKNRLVLIKADRRASVGRIVDLWNLCRSLDIEKINIATNQN